MGEKKHCCAGKVICPAIWFVILGMMNSISVKLAMETESQGKPEYGIHQFQKPWFLSTLAFIGMALAIFIHFFFQCRGKEGFPPITSLPFKTFCEFSIPALADIFQGIISAVTVAFVGVSVDVMMKSGTLVGVALITHFVFKKKIPPGKWFASAIVIIALVIVGGSSVMNAESSQTIHVGKGWVTLIVFLKIISQLGYAVKICYEEYFTQSRGYNDFMITGLEGIWMTFICCFILIPIVHYLPGDEGNGIHEDTIDSFLQIKNSPLLIGIVVVSIFLGLSYNVTSVMLTDRTSALVRSLVEAFRTFLLWIVQLVIFAVFSRVKALYKYREIGEEWCNGSYLQLVGYMLLVFGILQYRGIPKLPCLRYEPLAEMASDNQTIEDAYDEGEAEKTEKTEKTEKDLTDIAQASSKNENVESPLDNAE